MVFLTHVGGLGRVVGVSKGWMGRFWERCGGDINDEKVKKIKVNVNLIGMFCLVLVA